MKANELMTGDIILYECQDKVFPARVLEIYHKSFLVEEYNHEYESIEIDQDKVFPIPLTPEILEKNGFQVYEQDFTSNTVYKFGSLNYMEFEKFNKYFNIGSEITYRHFGREITYIHPLMRIYFVHELQHALRLCGIEKEITL